MFTRSFHPPPAPLAVRSDYFYNYSGEAPSTSAIGHMTAAVGGT